MLGPIAQTAVGVGIAQDQGEGTGGGIAGNLLGETLQSGTACSIHHGTVMGGVLPAHVEIGILLVVADADAPVRRNGCSEHHGETILVGLVGFDGKEFLHDVGTPLFEVSAFLEVVHVETVARDDNLDRGGNRGGVPGDDVSGLIVVEIVVEVPIPGSAHRTVDGGHFASRECRNRDLAVPGLFRFIVVLELHEPVLGQASVAVGDIGLLVVNGRYTGGREVPFQVRERGQGGVIHQVADLAGAAGSAYFHQRHVTRAQVHLERNRLPFFGVGSVLGIDHIAVGGAAELSVLEGQGGLVRVQGHGGAGVAETLVHRSRYRVDGETVRPGTVLQAVHVLVASVQGDINLIPVFPRSGGRHLGPGGGLHDDLIIFQPEGLRFRDGKVQRIAGKPSGQDGRQGKQFGERFHFVSCLL